MSQFIDKVLQAVPQWQENSDKIKIKPLSGGITNTNYLVEINELNYVIRLYGSGTENLGIIRKNEVTCHQIAAELNIAPALYSEFSSDQALVSQFISGNTLDEASASSAEILPIVTSAIKKYHQGPDFPGTFSPFGTVRDYLRLAKEKEVKFPDSLDSVIEKMESIEKGLQPHSRLMPCHNDLLAANFIQESDGRLWVLDWEYAAMGDPFFDLGNFSVNQCLNLEQKQHLLGCYFEQPSDWHMAYLELMCGASDLRESFWGFLQSAISAIEFDYMGYALKHFERFRELAEDEQLNRWLTTVSKAKH